MRAIQVTCPQCGAALRVAEGAESVTCEYCNTQAAVQRRTRVLERVMPPMRAAGVELPPRMAVQRRSGGGAVVIAVISVAIVAGIAASIATVAHQAARPSQGGAPAIEPPGSPGAASAGAADPAIWEGTGGILLADVDGDGSLDVIGRSRVVADGDLVSLIALDGKTGAERWHTAPIGTYTDTYQGVLAVAGDTVLFSDQHAKLSAWEVKTGAAKWTAQQPERAKRFCAVPDDPGAVVVLGTDDTRRPIALATGAAPAPAEVEPAPAKKGKPARAKKPSCQALPTDAGDDRDNTFGGDSSVGGKLGWWGATILVAPGGARFATGQREKGTHVPQLARLGDHGWTVDLPTDPLGAQESAPRLFEVSDLGPCASYELSGGGKTPRVACFAAADGARRWDVELLDDNPLEGMRITPAALYVSMWNLLEARDPATGAVLWTYGRLPD